jgi:hypothetical protein
VREGEGVGTQGFEGLGEGKAVARPEVGDTVSTALAAAAPPPPAPAGVPGPESKAVAPAAKGAGPGPLAAVGGGDLVEVCVLLEDVQQVDVG